MINVMGNGIGVVHEPEKYSRHFVKRASKLMYLGYAIVLRVLSPLVRITLHESGGVGRRNEH